MTREEPRSAPISAEGRNTTLDAVRGVAVLGILTMNAVSFGLVDMPAYFNLDAGGSRTWLDWAIGGMGEVLFDQKFMGLFSLLFGAGIAMFADRAAARQRRPVWFSLWRNALLLGIGIAHMALWEGDVLVLYAICSPLIIAARRLRPSVLVTIGAVLVLAVAVVAVAVQAAIDDPASQLSGYWLDGEKSAGIELWFVGDFGARALGMMLIGVALYRTGVVTGERPRGFYVRTARWGLGVGLPLSAAGLSIMAASGFSPDWALAGAAPNTLATIPLSLAYLSLIALWDRRAESGLRVRMRAVGRMALTNYLAQSVLGVIVLRELLGDVDLSRSQIALFILGVWAIQLWWSQAWLSRFRFGPAEWLWRCATYRRWQPLRVSPS
ncbi:MAG: DUF418 domain-containing protein [bacterium]|nr:DUF418 domain-containing protein [bacterium]